LRRGTCRKQVFCGHRLDSVFFKLNRPRFWSNYAICQADLLICAGRLPFKLAPVIRRIYDQMPQPKWVISMGACASSGGIFDNYAMVQGIDTVVPVDVYVPGCPPRPEGLLYGILLLQKKIRGETLADELLVWDCDLDDCRPGKELMFNFAEHRRVEHYGLITRQTGVVVPEPEEPAE